MDVLLTVLLLVALPFCETIGEDSTTSSIPEFCEQCNTECSCECDLDKDELFSQLQRQLHHLQREFKQYKADHLRSDCVTMSLRHKVNAGLIDYEDSHCKKPWPSDCTEIEFKQSGVYRIYPGSKYGGGGIEVYCDMDTARGGWTMIQRRSDGLINFNQNWTMYTKGFGNLSGDFWLGNSNLHTLTNRKKYIIRFDLVNENGAAQYAEYSNFRVSNKNKDFKCLFDTLSYTGDAGNAMLSSHGQSFSTFDADNDRSEDTNCADSYAGGWWYGDCGDTNLNGLSTPGSDVHWLQLRNLKQSEIKLRPDND